MRKIFFLLLTCLIAYNAFGQSSRNGSKEIPFNGIITDIAGNPAKGAKVYVEKGYASRSDKKGKFGLTNVRLDDTLTVEYQKKTYKIPVEGRKSIRIRIGDQIDNTAKIQTEEDKDLVDWGYGWVRQREKLESIDGISGEVLRRTGATNIIEALKGKVAGLNITSSGTLGGEASVNIRGQNSLNLSTTPLFVLDGVVVDSFDFVNVYDVESVQVLKDGSIYGSRGANGVIIVHTKKGGQ